MWLFERALLQLQALAAAYSGRWDMGLDFLSVLGWHGMHA